MFRKKTVEQEMSIRRERRLGGGFHKRLPRADRGELCSRPVPNLYARTFSGRNQWPIRDRRRKLTA